MMKTANPSFPSVPSLAVEAPSPILRTLSLRERDVHSLDLVEGERYRVAIQEGSGWVTMEGCPDDFALTVDQPRAAFIGPGRLVIEALGGGVTLRISSESLG